MTGGGETMERREAMERGWDGVGYLNSEGRMR
jgi:hypothetical protein